MKRAAHRQFHHPFGAGFGGLYRSLSQEVQDYIAHGDGAQQGGAASALSAEARARWAS